MCIITEILVKLFKQEKGKHLSTKPVEMDVIMKTQLAAMIVLTILFAGCTINPQDLAPKLPANNSPPQNARAAQPGLQKSSQITLTAAEVAKHSSASDCWMTISGKVYDLSSFTNHPGGSTYVPYCGTAGTTGFQTRGGTGTPSGNAAAMLSSYYIGALGQTVFLGTGQTGAGSAISQNGSNSGFGYGDDEDGYEGEDD
jgi:hypothetical protein